MSTIRSARADRSPRYAPSRADYVFQVLLLGPKGSGKTSLLESIKRDGAALQQAPAPTCGVDFWPCWWLDRGLKVRLTWYDASGDEKHRSQALGYVRNANAVLLICHPDQQPVNRKLWEEVEAASGGASSPPVLIGVVRPGRSAMLSSIECEVDAVTGQGVMKMVDRVVEECLLRVRKKSTPLLVLDNEDAVAAMPQCWCQ